jgi:DNA-binding protein HU-beta
LLAALLEEAVHRVPRGARHRRDDRARLADEPVQQRGLPHVGPSDDGEPERLLALLRDLDLRHPGQRLVEEVADAEAVLGGDRKSVEAEACELARPVVASLDLVDGDDHLLARLAQAGGDGGVVAHQAGAAVHHQEDEVGFGDRELCLIRSGAEERIVRLQKQAAGVDQLEGRPLPRCLGVVAVAGGPRARIDDRLAAAADPIEERGFADIGASDEGDPGEGDHLHDQVDIIFPLILQYAELRRRSIPMIKVDIINEVSKAADITKVKAEVAVEAVLEAMKDSMMRGERIELRGFGVFQVKPRKRGIGRNPRTGKEVKIPPGRTIRFKPGKDLQNLGQ